MGDSETLGSSGFQIICPEENAQLGDTFRSSDEAFKASAAHNNATGHNSSVVPCTNC
jgi:hypothetical protein